jgi:hypothetical protein
MECYQFICKPLYQDFDAQQRQRVDEAVEQFYDLQDYMVSKDG